ncbi:MAG: sugar dehydratase, partial [Armatimonadetes bacterium]|nr:sugar dehydratase [Armatimonadota bacterium]
AGQAFNFSNEAPLTVLQLVELISNQMGSDRKPVIQNEGTHEIRRQYLCAVKAREVLGWRPAFTMEEGLRKTIQWYKDFVA